MYCVREALDICTARGAVSSIAKIGGKHVGKHSIVVRLCNEFQIKQFQRLMFRRL